MNFWLYVEPEGHATSPAWRMHTVDAYGAAGSGTQMFVPAHPLPTFVVWHARPVRPHPSCGTFFEGFDEHVTPVGVGGVIFAEFPVLHVMLVQLVN